MLMKAKKKNRIVLMGNEAIGRGIVDNGCSVATAYPGTPSSEIIASIARLKIDYDLSMHVEWSVNEKAAYEVALSNSYMGCRSAVAMKQVGLNVASDSLMSSAYTGVTGGFIIISADDPGPHSSQTEQDSRLFAMLAKIPVLDPVSPRDAYSMTAAAFDLSEKYGIPVMLRPTTRVCHARQDVKTAARKTSDRIPEFEKNPQRWAATPKFRYMLHRELNKKLGRISSLKKFMPAIVNRSDRRKKLCILSSGVACAYVQDILTQFSLNERIDLIRAAMPYPLSADFLKRLVHDYRKVLVIEETYPVIELQIPDRRTVDGKLNGYVPQEGELTPDVLSPIVQSFAGKKPQKTIIPSQAGQRPSLCPGCSHRASFYAIKKALPKAVYTGDIGCYTLGINLGAVDTCLCMGASVNQAAGLFHARKAAGAPQEPVLATIGDSTFIHSGIPALINAVYNKARFILVILDNSTTAMTGNQPTASTGVTADGSDGTKVSLEKIVRGCGITFLKIIDPYRVSEMIGLLKEAETYTRSADGGIAVVIARRPCLMVARPSKSKPVRISRKCTNCGYCITRFECPALVQENDCVTVNEMLCSGCGVCIEVCPVGAVESC